MWIVADVERALQLIVCDTMLYVTSEASTLGCYGSTNSISGSIRFGFPTKTAVSVRFLVILVSRV